MWNNQRVNHQILSNFHNPHSSPIKSRFSHLISPLSSPFSHGQVPFALVQVPRRQRARRSFQRHRPVDGTSKNGWWSKGQTLGTSNQQKSGIFQISPSKCLGFTILQNSVLSSLSWLNKSDCWVHIRFVCILGLIAVPLTIFGSEHRNYEIPREIAVYSRWYIKSLIIRFPYHQVLHV